MTAPLKSKDRIIEMAAAAIKEKALKEELERRVSLACVAIFTVLNFALFFFANDFVCGAANLKYVALSGDAAIFAAILLKRNPFEFARIFFAACAGFYSYLYFCQDMGQAAALNAIYWLSATPLTIRMKTKITIFTLILSECFYVALIRTIIERL